MPIWDDLGLKDVKKAFDKIVDNNENSENKQKKEPKQEQAKVAQNDNASSDVNAALKSKITKNINDFHNMISSQGNQMQSQLGFDYKGATKDGTLSKADSFVLYAQFAGKMEDEGHLNGRISRGLNDNIKADIIAVIEEHLGQDAGVLKTLSDKQIDATIKLINADDSLRQRTMIKAMKDPDLKELREFPQNNVSSVFYIPAQDGGQDLVITPHKHSQTKTQAYVEVDAHIYTPDTPDVG